jgi:hypothetical protein
MKRLALLGMAVFGLTMIGAAACGSSPVQPGESTAAIESTPSFGKKGSSSGTVSAPTCESLVYPTSLCMPSNRPALCAALRNGGEFSHTVVGRPATETFTPTTTGALETVTMPRPYGLPPTVLTFSISNAQIEGPGMCQGVT